METTSLLELEKIIGFSGQYPAAGPVMLPAEERGFVVGLGSLVVIGDVSDPHNQAFLRGHDADVTAVDVSPGSRFIASGQARSPFAGSAESPVICWDRATGKGASSPSCASRPPALNAPLPTRRPVQLLWHP
jgi:hypothetical protein